MTAEALWNARRVRGRLDSSVEPNHGSTESIVRDRPADFLGMRRSSHAFRPEMHSALITANSIPMIQLPLIE